ncbi:hypothetical protein AB9F45_39515, partial [Rhizobium leguminosarum]
GTAGISNCLPWTACHTLLQALDLFVRATDAKSAQRMFKYNIPDESDAGGKIYVPKIVATSQAASQSDLDKLAEEVES